MTEAYANNLLRLLLPESVRLGVEPATAKSQVQHSNHYASMVHGIISVYLSIICCNDAVVVWYCAVIDVAGSWWAGMAY